MIAKEIIISKINTMADGTLRLQVDFNELTPDEIAMLFRLKSNGTTGVLFTESDMLTDFKQAMLDMQSLKQSE